MNEFKAKGKKHHTNKSKYKSKVQKVKEYSKEISVQSLSKNWDRYEEPEDDYNEEYISSKDFNLLADTPITKPNYFQFKKDKEFLPTENTKLHVGDIFKLNLDILKLGIATIPFYERLNIDKGLFKKDEIDEMHTTAQKTKMTYENYLKIINQVDLNQQEQEENVSNKQDKLSDNIEEILPEIEDLEINQITSNSSLNNILKDKVAEELENWLDDILD